MAHDIDKGVYAAALTPLHVDLSCNEELLAEHCLQLIERGCKGVVLFGTTGEGASFSTREKKRALDRVVECGLLSDKIIVGIASTCVQDVVELAEKSLELNCLACLIAPPFFFKDASEDGVISFYREALERIANSSLQVILYHIPQYTGIPLTLKIVQTLCSEFPGSVIGIKDSEGNMPLMNQILHHVPECKVFIGGEKKIAEGVKAGVWGAISGKANVWPELVCDLFETGSSLTIEKTFAQLDQHPFIVNCKAMLTSVEYPYWKLVRPPLIANTSIKQSFSSES